MSKTVILYASHKAMDETSQPIKAGKSVIWIRTEILNNICLMDALDIANPFKGETVLNTIPLTVNKNGVRD